MTFAILLAYRYVASRYILDFLPPLLLASVVGAWEAYHSFRGRPIGGRVIMLAIVAVGAATVVIGILVGVRGRVPRIDDFNPGLWMWLTQIRLG
jgi:hypothetical protein